MTSDQTRTLDGNVLAGPLSDVFAAEVTTAVARCGGCGAQVEVAQLAVYGPEPGLVARCPGCSHVMLRMVRTDDATWLDLGGIASLRIPLPAVTGGGSPAAGETLPPGSSS